MCVCILVNIEMKNDTDTGAPAVWVLGDPETNSFFLFEVNTLGVFFNIRYDDDRAKSAGRVYVVMWFSRSAGPGTSCRYAVWSWANMARLGDNSWSQINLYGKINLVAFIVLNYFFLVSYCSTERKSRELTVLIVQSCAMVPHPLYILLPVSWSVVLWGGS